MKKIVILAIFVFNLHGMDEKNKEKEELFPIQFLKNKSNDECMVITPDWVLDINTIKAMIYIRNNMSALNQNFFIKVDVYGGYGSSPEKYRRLKQAIDNIVLFEDEKRGHYQYFIKETIALNLIKKSELAKLHQVIEDCVSIKNN